jgi:ubiquinone/menaquinone biosynthesis C-methylase UbiE
MATEPRNELSSTYFVADRASHDERTRVEIQDLMLTKAMGGVLPEQPDPARFQRIIDIGCGTGGWLIEMAKTYPTTHLLLGADISIHMVKYARERAVQQHVNDRVEFHVMDVLRMIEFPEHSFDLVNQRLGWSYLHTWDWPLVLQKYQQVARQGGTIRITESDIFGITNSPALTELSDLARNALYARLSLKLGISSVVVFRRNMAICTFPTKNMRQREAAQAQKVVLQKITGENKWGRVSLLFSLYRYSKEAGDQENLVSHLSFFHTLHKPLQRSLDKFGL